MKLTPTPAYYILVAVAIISCTCTANAQCPTDRYIYSYLIKAGIQPESSVLCIKDDASQYTNIKKAPMPQIVCLPPISNILMFGIDVQMCGGEYPPTAIETAIRNVASSLNQVCSDSRLKINIEEECEEYDGKVFLHVKPASKFDDPYSTAATSDSWFPDQPNHYSALALNFTNEFKEGNSSRQIPPHCWSSNCNNQLGYTLSDNVTYACMDLESILMHEMGHILGLAHPWGMVDASGNPTGTDGFGAACNTEETFRASAQEQNALDKENMSWYSKFNYKNRSAISCYMGCALRHLYCADVNGFQKLGASIGQCDPTSIETITPVERDVFMELYPQPTVETVTLLIRSTQRRMRLYIYNELGSVVETREIEMNDVQQTVVVDVQNYTSGVYYAVLTTNMGITSSRFIVKR